MERPGPERFPFGIALSELGKRTVKGEKKENKGRGKSPPSELHL